MANPSLSTVNQHYGESFLKLFNSSLLKVTSTIFVRGSHEPTTGPPRKLVTLEACSARSGKPVVRHAAGSATVQGFLVQQHMGALDLEQWWFFKFGAPPVIPMNSLGDNCSLASQKQLTKLLRAPLGAVPEAFDHVSNS